MGDAAADVHLAEAVLFGVPLVLQHVFFGYDRTRPVLRGVSVVFTPGKLVAIIGPNGAGKSTLLRLLAGLRRAQTGEALLNEATIAEIPERERARKLVYLPQQSNVAFDYTVGEVVSMGRYAHGSGASGATESSLQTVGLAERADDPFHTLSAGQQQRANLARAIAQLGFNARNEERYLLADEPVSAMDPHFALASMLLLRELASRGVGIAAVVHDLSLALRFADEVVLLDQAGRVHSYGETADALTPAALKAVFEVDFEQLNDSRGKPAAFVPAPL
ncbi:MAG: ABC transporter ATP-binding protein [Phycisphaerae bacterium]|nr:ABC transporter ATP-binding protein [Phycisphaerae bacterium]